MICEHGKLTHIGTFPTKELAAEAYSLAAVGRAAEKLARAKAAAINKLEVARRVVDWVQRANAAALGVIDSEVAKRVMGEAMEIVSK